MPVDVNENTIRIRVKDPDLFVDDSFRTITISESQGIKAVIGKLKSDPGGATVIQNYMFEKDKWTTAEAEKWVSDHKRHAGMEKRTFDGNFRVSIDNKIATVLGTAIPYNKLSINPIPGLPPEVKERILPGAFKRSIEGGSNIFILWNHELKYVLGRTSNGTLRLKEDENGIQFENVPPDVQWAKDLTHQIKRGDISNMSFGFGDNVEPSWTKEEGYHVRNVRDATLYEISVVTFPVYESTTVFSRNSNLMMVDDAVLDYVVEENITEEMKAEAERFKELDIKFESLKKQWL